MISAFPEMLYQYDKETETALKWRKTFLGRLPVLVLLFQGFFGTDFRTFIAQNTFCSIYSFSGIICHVHIHGTDCFAFAAGDTFALVTGNTQQ